MRVAGYATKNRSGEILGPGDLRRRFDRPNHLGKQPIQVKPLEGRFRQQRVEEVIAINVDDRSHPNFRAREMKKPPEGGFFSPSQTRNRMRQRAVHGLV